MKKGTDAAEGFPRLGIAPRADRTAMEQRSRGIFSGGSGSAAYLSALFLSILLSIVCFTSACRPLRAEQILGKEVPEPVSETGNTGADPGTADGLFATCDGDGDGSSADRETGPAARSSPAGFPKLIRSRGSGMRIRRAS